MSGTYVLAYLKQLCKDIDAGKQLTKARRVATSVASAALVAGALGACDRSDDPVQSGDNQLTAEICNDSIDNDANGMIDCQDEACLESDICTGIPVYAEPFEPEPTTAEYAVPFEEPDPAVSDYAAPFEDPADMGAPEYAAPFED